MTDALTQADIETLGFLESPVPQLVLSYRRILAVNRATCDLFGYTGMNMVGASVRQMYSSLADYSAIGARCEKWFETHRTYEDQRFMQRANGDIFWVRARGVTLSPEDPFRLTVWSFDPAVERTARTGALSPREEEIANYIVNGWTSKRIAQALNISHRTVEVHRAKLMRKLGASNTAELVSRIVVAE